MIDYISLLDDNHLKSFKKNIYSIFYVKLNDPHNISDKNM
jgi:hypothetical protein